MDSEHPIYLVYPPGAEAGTIETLPETKGLIKIQSDRLQLSDISFTSDDKVCMTSEACLDLLRNKMESANSRRAIDLLKDKSKFRDLIQPLFPDYSYRTIPFDDILHIKVQGKSVLKPQKGCFGTGVRILDEDADMLNISRDIRTEIDKNASVLSESVLSTNEFILEDYIEGEEYAVDMFYDKQGIPRIVNIYHHPMPAIPAYLHMIYYTGKEVFDTIYRKAIVFFTRLNRTLKVKNFVLHSEFRLTDDNLLFPIEINAMRFGGMGLGNMVYHALGINPYVCFGSDISPDWDDVWSKAEHAESLFAFFIAYNGKSINKKECKPNVQRLKAGFTHILNESLFDYREQLAFGIFTLRETKANLYKLLQIDFDDYFEPGNTSI